MNARCRYLLAQVQLTGHVVSRRDLSCEFNSAILIHLMVILSVLELRRLAFAMGWVLWDLVDLEILAVEKG